jgi:hypothetical protein
LAMWMVMMLVIITKNIASKRMVKVKVTRRARAASRLKVETEATEEAVKQ